jgi:flagellar motility protein MotE (MotC chaperone)
MNLKIKDFILIALVTVASFPILYLIMLFITGEARVEFGKNKEDETKKEKIQLIKQSAHKDSLFAMNSRTYQALQQERLEIEKERQKLREQQDRINLLQSEIETERKKLTEERNKIEKTVSIHDSLSARKLKDIAKVYAAMRPSEAATILETMDDAIVASIVRSINDDRQKAKILSLFPTDKAARISKIIGVQ